MVTNMGLFKIFYISILFFNESLFAGLNTIEQNDLIIKKNEDSLIEKYDSNQKILIDSLVYPKPYATAFNNSKAFLFFSDLPT